MFIVIFEFVFECQLMRLFLLSNGIEQIPLKACQIVHISLIDISS